MVDRLISAYRAEIYDWSISDWRSFCKENKRAVFFLVSYIIMPFIYLPIWYKTKSGIVLLIAILAAGALAVYIDRYIVKQHRRFLLRRQGNLEKMASFLKTSVPGVDLYNSEQIDLLVERLTERITAKIPFKNFLAGIGSFTKAIILPVVTYVTGVYSGTVGQISIETLVTYGVAIIMLLGSIRLVWGGASYIIRTVLFRDYDAAVTLREDLLDIKLLYFSDT